MSDKGRKIQAKATGKDKDEGGRSAAKLGREEYEQELGRLQAELVQVQQWVQRTGAKICIVFEGRDGAGKGGAIKAVTERVSRRVFRDRSRVRAMVCGAVGRQEARPAEHHHAPAEQDSLRGHEPTKPEKIKLPERQKRGGYREPEHHLRYVQERF